MNGYYTPPTQSYGTTSCPQCRNRIPAGSPVCPCCGCPVAAVAVETAESRTVGFCNYLGEVFDTGAGAPRELYGKQLEAVISIEIRGQRAADCEQGCETAAEVLLGRLPAGIRPGELNWEALTWERETGLFLRRGRLRCRAYFLARAEEGDTVFLDFRLKGAVTT